MKSAKLVLFSINAIIYLIAVSLRAAIDDIIPEIAADGDISTNSYMVCASLPYLIGKWEDTLILMLLSRRKLSVITQNAIAKITVQAVNTANSVLRMS